MYTGSLCFTFIVVAQCFEFLSAVIGYVGSHLR